MYLYQAFPSVILIIEFLSKLVKGVLNGTTLGGHGYKTGSGQRSDAHSLVDAVTIPPEECHGV
jgi:hypothetical protein